MKLSELTALYTDLDWQYNNAMSGPYVDYRDKTDEGETVAGLKDGRISGAWRPMVCVGTDKWQKSEIQRLWDISHDIYYMDYLIDGKLSEVSRFLLKKGYRARPVYTQIIDLTKTEEELHADLRKSYKSLCNCQNWYIPTPEIVFDNDYWQQFIKLHKANHEKNRPQESYRVQTDMLLQAGEAILCISHDEMDRVNAGVLIYFNNEQAYYACSASKCNILTHHLIWQAMLWLKIHKHIVELELGEQVYHVGQIMHNGKPASDKHVNISHFKAGFGVVTQTRLILEKP